MKEQRYTKVYYLLNVGALIFLVLITYYNSNPPLFDEVLFVRNMPLYEEYGLSKKFLVEMYDQAPGPLYQIVHSFFEPVTNLETPGIRVVNVFLFSLIIIITYLILKIKGDTNDNNLLIAFNLIAVPVVWQVTGMAMTEIPAMFFAILSLLILVVLVQRSVKNDLSGFLLAIAGGLCLGCAIIGRTPYLMLIPAICVLGFNPLAEKQYRQTLPVVIVITYIISAIVVCLPIFLTWKGLVPPHQAVISEGGLKLWHGVLAFAYAGIIMLLITPQWFTINKRIFIGALMMVPVFLIMNLLWFKVQYQPLSDFLSRILPGSAMAFYGVIIAPVLMAFCAYFIYNLILQMFSHRNNSFYIAIALAMIFVLFTCINIKHIFSSRYVAQVAPFLVLLIADRDTFDRYKILRLLVGIAMGYISLQTYANP